MPFDNLKKRLNGIPHGMVPNPNYVEGDGTYQYMPKGFDENEALEEPIIDPINLAATAMTGGLSQGGAALQIAAKNKATRSLLDALKEAAAKRQERMKNQGVGGQEQAQNIGNLSMYKKK